MTNPRPLDRTKIRVYIDMDHTFCDFTEALNFWRSRATTEVEVSWPWSQVGFFTSLLPMEGAIDFWKTWKDVADLWFLTRPSMPNLHCYTEKAQWIKKHLGEEGLQKLIISPRKDLYHGEILIDDSDNCGQPFFEGKWWKFGSAGCPDWDACHWLMVEEYRQSLKK